MFKLKHLGYRDFALVALMLLTLALSQIPTVSAKAGPLTLEKSQEWHLIESACIPYGHNVFVEDVDGDGTKEIITGGSASDGTRRNAMLTIWNWNGTALALEKSQYWYTLNRTMVVSVYVSDVDGDGVKEIITGGRAYDGSGSYAQLRIWRWDGYNLALKSSKEWAGASVSSIFVSDVDKDGTLEMLTGGRVFNDTKSSAQLRIWHWKGNSLVLEKSVEWCAANESSVTSVYASDVDGDDAAEIITCGYDHDLKNSTGQLRLWKWDGKTLTLKENQEWRMTEGYMLNIAGGVMGNTIANALDVGDVDGDGKPEVVTGGFTYDGTHANAQVRIWSWNGKTLTTESSCEWVAQDINEVKSVSINDVDGDGKQEIVTSGLAAVIGGFASNTAPEVAQLRVWGWDGKTLTLKNSEEWCTGDGSCAWSVATGDVDKDGVMEIITGGCIYIGAYCNAQLRIWSVPSPSTHAYELYIAAAVAVIAILCLGTYLYTRRRK